MTPVQLFEPAVYVRAGAEVDRVPFEDMTLPAVMRAVLTDPMTQTELTARMREAAFDSTTDDGVLHNVVGEDLPRGGFVKGGEVGGGLSGGSAGPMARRHRFILPPFRTRLRLLFARSRLLARFAI